MEGEGGDGDGDVARRSFDDLSPDDDEVVPLLDWVRVVVRLTTTEVEEFWGNISVEWDERGLSDEAKESCLSVEVCDRPVSSHSRFLPRSNFHAH